MDSDQSSLTLTRIVPVVDAVTLRFLAALPFLELLITSLFVGDVYFNFRLDSKILVKN